MNDTIIAMVAAQLGIPPEVLAELKSTRPELMDAELDPTGTTALLTVAIHSPQSSFTIFVTVPVVQLKRLPGLYRKVVQLANPAN